MILCYQPKTNNKKTLKMTNKGSASKAPEKISVRKQTWNYKPSNRYNISLLQNLSNKGGELILCEECASRSYLNSEFKKSISHKGISIIKKNTSRLLDEKIKIENKIPTSGMNNIRNNILILMGSSPRSCYVRKNVNFLINHKENSKKFCELNLLKIKIKDRENKKERNYIKSLNEEREIVEKQEFDNIMNKAGPKKLNPLQLKKPELMLNFLENYLGVKR